MGHDVPLVALATRLGGHPNATRAHLDALVEEGLAEARSLPRSGPGRPALGWSLTTAGRRAVAGDPSIGAYAEMLAVMVSHLAEAPDSDELARAIGRSWGSERVVRPSREALIQALTDLGFEPEDVGESILLRACPMLDAAHEHPAVVCAIHAGLIAGASGNDAAQLRPFAQPGACRIDVA